MGGVEAQLCGSAGYKRFIVEALDQTDVDIVARAVTSVEAGGLRFFTRSAPSYIRARSGRDVQTIEANRFPFRNAPNAGKPGLIVVGSITDVTASQRREAVESGTVCSVEMQARELYMGPSKRKELIKVSNAIKHLLGQGKHIMLYTSGYYQHDGEHALVAKQRVLMALAEIVPDFVRDIGFVLTKGSDTGYLVMSEGLHMERSIFDGLLMPGVGVCFAGPESRAPGLPVILFPGNTGSQEALREAVQLVEQAQKGT